MCVRIEFKQTAGKRIEHKMIITAIGQLNKLLQRDSSDIGALTNDEYSSFHVNNRTCKQMLRD